MKGRRDLRVSGFCPEHGEDVTRVLPNSTFTEARRCTWDCPHEEDGNQSVQVIEIVDVATREVVWKRPARLHVSDGLEHYDYKFD